MTQSLRICNCVAFSTHILPLVRMNKAKYALVKLDMRSFLCLEHYFIRVLSANISLAHNIEELFIHGVQ